MIQAKKLMVGCALLGALATSFSFALAKPGAVEQPNQLVPIASDVDDAQVPADADGRKHYFIELAKPSAAEIFAAGEKRYSTEARYVGRGSKSDTQRMATERAASEASQQAWSNDADQRTIVDRLVGPEFNAKVTYRAQNAINGIAVMALPTQVGALEKIPGVKRVTVIVPLQKDAVSSVNFIGSRNFWNAAGINAHGENVGVGVIDSGIDFVHTGNGGPGGTSYNANATAVDGTTPQTTFPTSKVVWGYDLVGDAYTGGNVTAPDPNPMDTNGHGTACASLIGSFGVNADGTTYNGPYDSTAPDIAAMRISPGIAPQASLYAFRVFGTAGSTGVSSQAVNMATAIRLWQLSPVGTPLPPEVANLSPSAVTLPRTPVLSVINMSLGSGNGFASPYNEGTVAVQNATAAGLSMIISAGNSYDSYYVVGSPSVTTGSISVAATYNAQQPGFTATAPVNGPQPALNLSGLVGTAAIGITNAPNILAPTATRYANPRVGNFQHTAGTTTAAILTAALLNDAGEPVTDASGNPTNPPGGNPYPGQVVLIDRGSVGFHQKALAASRAGAAAAVIINDRPGTAFGMAAAAGLPQLTIPVVSVSQSDGAQFTNTGTANTPPARPGLMFSISPENASNADDIAAYSSRGIRRGDNRLKPDMAAPAENVTVNVAGSGNGVGSFNGTSSAAPHVAGSMVLLRQLTDSHTDVPQWSMEELKALMMNSASGNPLVGGANGSVRYGLARVGLGRLNLNPAGGMPTAVALSTDSDFPVSVSFGSVNVPADQTITSDKTFKVVNKLTTGGPRTFSLSFDDVTAAPGVSFTFPDGPSVIVPAGGSTTIRVRMTADGAAMRHARDVSASASQTFALGPPSVLLPRTFPSEAAGNIRLDEVGGSGNAMRLSVHSIPRPVSSLSVTPAALTFPAVSETQTYTFNGLGINTGTNLDTTVTPVADIQSHAKGFELQFNRTSAQTDPFFKTAEILQVGVTSDFARRPTPYDTTPTNNQSAVVVFAVATASDFNTASSTGTDVRVLVDTTGDNVEDITVRSLAWNDPSYSTTSAFGSNMYLSVTNPGVSTTLTTTGFTTNILSGRASNALNNNLVMLPVNLQRLGVTAANPRIRYKVTSSFFFGTFLSETPWLTYDVSQPGVDASVGTANEPFVTVAAAANTIPVDVNTARHAANRSLGLLMVYPHNASTTRVQTVLAPPQLNTVVSRKTHGTAGTFDVNMPLTGLRGVENRIATGGHDIVMTLNVPVTSGTVSVTGGTATVDSVTFTGGQVFVHLSGVPNAQVVQLQLANVNGTGTNMSIDMGFLVGDAVESGAVGSGDISFVKSVSGSALSPATFRADMNLSGTINAGDVSLTKSTSGNVIP